MFKFLSTDDNDAENNNTRGMTIVLQTFVMAN